MVEISKEVLNAEFGHVSGVTYLDHAGATLYSSKQLEQHAEDLTSNLYSNPHSRSPSSKVTSDLIDSIRELVLRHFHTDSDQYSVIFTPGCTGALNLLSHAFPWKNCSGNSSGEQSMFCYLDDNHTSVVGMREVASFHGARTMCASPNSLKKRDHSHLQACSCCTRSQPHPPHQAPPSHHQQQPHPQPHPSSSYSLFAYPAQSNFSGSKYPLSWCSQIPNEDVVISCSECELPTSFGSWKVVLDAASYVSTSPLDLSTCQPDFVGLSFYKLFGFPTGLGALLVRKENGDLLHKPYYGGGTVKATDSWSSFHLPKDDLHERLEDGTLPFLEILALRHGFATLDRLGRSMESIQQHTFQLARTVYRSMCELRHGNGAKVCVIYSKSDFEDPDEQGPIVNFNLLKANGELVGYSQVEKLASVYAVHLRTGCFCNTGACMRWLGINSERLRYHLETLECDISFQQGHVCGGTVDLIDGKPTGSVRISLGYMSTQEDILRFLHFIEDCFVSSPPKDTAAKTEVRDSVSVVWPRKECMEECGLNLDRVHLISPSMPLISCGDSVEAVSESEDSAFGLHPSIPTESSSSSLSLLSITLYPIKSCAGFKVQQWPVGEKGLYLDRNWMITGQHGSLLSQKQEPNLCKVHPVIDLATSTLTLNAPGCEPISLPIHEEEELSEQDSGGRVSLVTRVCGDCVQGQDCGASVSAWLNRLLGRECRLVRQNPYHHRKRSTRNHHYRHHASNEKGPPSLSLVNEAQYLLLSENSLKDLLGDIQRSLPEWGEVAGVSGLASRFRANLVVGGDMELRPYTEEDWNEVKIGHHVLQVAGKCTRCQMICVDPETGERSSEPLKTLLSLRGNKATFGIYLRQ